MTSTTISHKLKHGFLSSTLFPALNPSLIHYLSHLCSTIFQTQSPCCSGRKRRFYPPIHHSYCPTYSSRPHQPRPRPRRPVPLGRLREKLRVLHIPPGALPFLPMLARRSQRLRRLLLSPQTWLQQQHVRCHPRQHHHTHRHGW